MTARNRVGPTGGAVARLIENLDAAGLIDFTRTHIIGHSLGSHVAGHCGKQVTRGRIAAIFATDPAGPLVNKILKNFSIFLMIFLQFSLADSAGRLAPGDAVYTEAIHTNAGNLGFDQPITQASFYPNWGSSQPGCGILDVTGACAHERSNLFYSESINSPRFVARRCTGWQQIVNRSCPGTGVTGIMGGDAQKSLDGVFFLETNNNSPFARG